MSESKLRYFARFSREAENIARALRSRGINANLYQHKFIIAGPTESNPFLPNSGTVYEAPYYEECLEQLLSGENHTVPIY